MLRGEAEETTLGLTESLAETEKAGDAHGTADIDTARDDMLDALGDMEKLYEFVRTTVLEVH